MNFVTFDNRKSIKTIKETKVLGNEHFEVTDMNQKVNTDNCFIKGENVDLQRKSSNNLQSKNEVDVDYGNVGAGSQGSQALEEDIDQANM